MDKFIKLKKYSSALTQQTVDLYVQPMFIEAMERLEPEAAGGLETNLHMMGGYSFVVFETIEQILSKISDLNKWQLFDPIQKKPLK